MKNSAFFFQGDSLLLPKGADESSIKNGFPLNLADGFDEPDIFEIPELGMLPSAAISVVSVLPETTLPENWKSIPVRRFLTLSASEDGSLQCGAVSNILRACHVAQWRQESRFCGRCGAENCDLASEEEPVKLPKAVYPPPPPPLPQMPPQPQRICPKCGRLEFPKISPAVIVIVSDGYGRILLAHNKRFKAGMYSHIAGFCEAGESLEEAAEREIYEEVSIKIKDIAYVKSQPWPFPNSLMLGFKARYESGTIRPDGEEIEDAGWFEKDSLPELPAAGSLSRYLINLWLGDNLN